MFMQFAAAVSSWSYGIHMSHLYQWLIISELCRTNLANCAFDRVRVKTAINRNQNQVYRNRTLNLRNQLPENRNQPKSTKINIKCTSNPLISVYGRFAPLTFRPLDVSPLHRTFRPLDVSPPGRFAPKTFRPLDVSPGTRMFRPLDVSPPGRFATCMFRPRLWSFRPSQWTVRVRPRL